ncbi:hypothetical protein PM10SUCC1_21640 [Propionigenium maris DSM 9537]|uniref:GGDEF domain-containing protein n=2 Tax=Propionigenium TaxID=2332 RepID=A0A9W6GM32_9FUSO|nr:hypothetical protein PM10SUCC1_21640 [Propionigenium maris DSM 9537]
MKSARSQKNNVFSFKHRLADGEIKDVQVFSGPITYEDKGCLFSVIHDVTDREKAYKQIEHQAYYDSLTALPNRERFSKTLKNLTTSPGRVSSGFALLHIDLDHFKDINDNFGHDIGDLLLIKAAERLQRIADLNSTIYRLEGDEFAVILKIGWRYPPSVIKF